jgi:hypothetical protein
MDGASSPRQEQRQRGAAGSCSRSRITLEERRCAVQESTSREACLRLVCTSSAAGSVTYNLLQQRLPLPPSEDARPYSQVSGFHVGGSMPSNGSTRPMTSSRTSSGACSGCGAGCSSAGGICGAGGGVTSGCVDLSRSAWMASLSSLSSCV